MENCWEDVPHSSQDCYPHYNLFQSSIFYDTDNFRVKYEDCLPSESSENEERSAEPPDKPEPVAREKRVVKKSELYQDPEEFVSRNQECSSTGIEAPCLPSPQPWGYDWTKQSWVKELAPMVVIRDESRLLFSSLVDSQDRVKLGNSKGESMMQKMGWRGGALGKTGNGILRSISPDPAYMFRPSAGFGQRTRAVPSPLSPPAASTPNTPVIPNTPVAPNTPVVPNTLVAPHTPVTLNTSVAPNTAAAPNTPATPNTPAAPSTPTKSHSPHKPEGKSAKVAGGKEDTKPAKKTTPKRDVFRTNVLLQILDFVQDDTETELVFDPSLRQHERRHIASLVAAVGDRGGGGGGGVGGAGGPRGAGGAGLAAPAHVALARRIHRRNRFVLDAAPHKHTRQLAIYKEPPDDVYLVTPDDFAQQQEPDASMDMEDDENPFLRSIKKSIKKDEPVSTEDDKNVEPKSISNKFEARCSITKSDKRKADSPVSAADRMLEFFLEFANADAYKEMKFLGAFTDEQITAINSLLNDLALCILDWRSFAGDRELAHVFRRGRTFVLREGANGTTEVHKVPSGRRNTE